MMPQMYENVTNNLPSSEIPVVHLFTSYFSLTCSSLCSCEPPPANCLFVFCYFSSSSYGTFNYYFSYPSVLVLFFLFLLILFLLLSFIILCNPDNSVHFTPFPDTCVCAVCVCVCVCVCCVCARGAACCSLLLGAMFDDAMLLNKSVLTVLCCQPCL